MESSTEKNLNNIKTKEKAQGSKTQVLSQNDIKNKTYEKIKLPKRKYAIIHGYFGQNYSGNQKNPNVHTVEEELENALYKLKFISPCNYGNLSKIDWMRASRTDKGVSAIMNVISVKLHKYPDIDENQMKINLNKILPKDIKIFRIIEVSGHFDSKENNDRREYHYILPSFLLEPLKEKIERKEGEYIDIPKEYKGNYKYVLNEEEHKKLKELCKIYLGTKKYHNYTKKIGFTDPSSQRHIYEFSCDEIINFEEFQCIKFKIIGQSFLYNQIRKMIGMLIEIFRNNKDEEYFKNSFLSNKYEIPKAPGEGLYLRTIDYSKYNDRKLNKKNNIFLTEEDQKEMENFTKELIIHIKDEEIKKKCFSSWQYKLDHIRELIL